MLHFGPDLTQGQRASRRGFPVSIRRFGARLVRFQIQLDSQVFVVPGGVARDGQSGAGILSVVTPVSMPQINLPRNVRVYDNSSQTSVLVAGFMQLGHTTTTEFYACLEICFQWPAARNFRLCGADGTVRSRANGASLVPLGDYYVVSTGMEPLSWVLIFSRPLDVHAGCPHY